MIANMLDTLSCIFNFKIKNRRPINQILRLHEVHKQKIVLIISKNSITQFVKFLENNSNRFIGKTDVTVLMNVIKTDQHIHHFQLNKTIYSR